MKCLSEALGEWPAEDTLHILVIGNKMDDKILNHIVSHTQAVASFSFLFFRKRKQRHLMVSLLSTKLGRNSFDLLECVSMLSLKVRVTPIGVYPHRFEDVHQGDELIWFASLNNTETGEKKESDTPIGPAPVSTQFH